MDSISFNVDFKRKTNIHLYIPLLDIVATLFYKRIDQGTTRSHSNRMSSITNIEIWKLCRSLKCSKPVGASSTLKISLHSWTYLVYAVHTYGQLEITFTSAVCRLLAGQSGSMAKASQRRSKHVWHLLGITNLLPCGAA